MILKHFLKSASHDIPIAEEAKEPTAFKTEKSVLGKEETYLSVKWSMPVASYDGKYDGHRFEIVLSVGEIETFMDSLRKLKERIDDAQVD